MECTCCNTIFSAKSFAVTNLVRNFAHTNEYDGDMDNVKGKYLNPKADGMSVELIVKYTGLTAAEIEAL